MTNAPSDSTPPAATPSFADRLRNFMIVSVAIILTVLVVLGIRTQNPTNSLETLAKEALPLEIALTNGKPSLVEFYANWCTSCQAMAGDMKELKTQYSDRINFVMLNVDNTKWLPEMLHYRVDGIPHFVYLDSAGTDQAAAIGEQPKTIVASNLDALLTHTDLPFKQSVGLTSDLEAPLSRDAVINRDRSDDPRSHGAQAAN